MIAVGRLTRPHGLRGEVIFLPYLQDLDLLPDLANQRVVLRQDERPVQERTILSWRRAHKRLLMRLEGCHSLEQAEALRDAEVLIPRESFPPLEADEYYWFDIEGLTVYDSDGRRLGTVCDIIYTGSNDVYVVRDGSHETLVPALKDVVRTIDLDRREIRLFPAPGLLD